MEYVKTKDCKDEEEKREALLKELKSIDADLQKSEGPYVGGNDVNAADLKLGPQLKHVSPGHLETHWTSFAQTTFADMHFRTCTKGWVSLVICMRTCHDVHMSVILMVFFYPLILLEGQ